jgi:hypothetical protein
MEITSNLFPSTSCNAAYVDMMAEEAKANGYKEVVLEKCGYVLVNRRLVPYTFLERVQNQIEGANFEYGLVLAEADIFSEDFLRSLCPEAREVLMPCVLILIERGDFELNFFN